MDAYDQLRAKAAEKRDAAIKKARTEYGEAIRQIAKLKRRFAVRTPKPPKYRTVRPSKGRPYRGLTTVQAAERILAEGMPLTLVELTLEVQARGCRSEDDPRRVANALKTALRYHPERFRLGDDDRWAVYS